MNFQNKHHTIVIDISEQFGRFGLKVVDFIARIRMKSVFLFNRFDKFGSCVDNTTTTEESKRAINTWRRIGFGRIGVIQGQQKLKRRSARHISEQRMEFVFGRRRSTFDQRGFRIDCFWKETSI
jgi:hypothetical protein